MDDIQGEVVPGFFKPHQTLLGLRIPDRITALRRFKRIVKDLSAEITTARQTLDDRRAHREFRRRTKSGASEAEQAGVLTAIGFSYRGLIRLTPSASLITSEPFRLGLVARSTLLGDPIDASEEGAPWNWVVGAPGAELDALVIVAGNQRNWVTKRARELAERLMKGGVTVADDEDGDVRTGEGRGREHFGFKDGISQPGIRGRASDSPNDFITERYIASSEVPERWLYGYPGQDLVWPGEFVIGYPKTGPDPLVPGPS